jgi:hypothetical protein
MWCTAGSMNAIHSDSAESFLLRMGRVVTGDSYSFLARVIRSSSFVQV